ncbi:macrolide-efflux protein [Anaeramoeba flamelloides]|uniref:Macrolide-efflux protein n=1 Tax=Anaeramoeba flamelloides TaxID=1746091 RepID=A0ABQ8Y365_9EUKA|nr:macrolide-efflux protein [Anaeramoeba flamelloides]
MITSDLIRSALVLLFILVPKVKSVWFLLGIIFLQFSVSSFFLPARTAIIAKIVRKNNIVLANTFDSATWSALYFIGSSIGGIVADYAGLTWAFIIDSLTYLISSVCVYISLKAYKNRILKKGKIIFNNPLYSNSSNESLMSSSSESEKNEKSTNRRGTKLKNIILDIEEEEKEEGEKEEEEVEDKKKLGDKSKAKEVVENKKDQKNKKSRRKNGFLESVRFLRKNPHTFAIICVKSTGALIWGAITIIIIQIIEQHFKINKSISIPIGILYASEGIGSMISPLLAENYFKKTTRKRWVSILLGFFLFEIGLVILIIGSFLENFYIFIFGNFIRAGGIGLIWVFSTVLIQNEKPEMIGRLFGFDYGFFFLCIMISYVWGGFGKNLKLKLNTTLEIQFLVGVFIICCWIIYYLKRKKNFYQDQIIALHPNSKPNGNDNKKKYIKLQEKSDNSGYLSNQDSNIQGSTNEILTNEGPNNDDSKNRNTVSEELISTESNNEDLNIDENVKLIMN